MKKCPQCGTQYSDVTLSYCLQDGAPLIVEPRADTPTVVLGETETVVPRRDAMRVQVDEPAAGGWEKSQVTHVASPPQRKNSNTLLAVLLTAVGMLILFGIVGIAAFLFWPRPDRPSIQNSNNGNRVIASVDSPTPSIRASPVLTPQTTISNSPRPSPEPPVVPPAASSRYPATTRLKFARGSYTTNFSGDVNPGDSRSLVLACRSGQSLTATITSGASCVNVRGGPSMRMTTSGGDNYITVTNTCSAVARFSVSITII